MSALREEAGRATVRAPSDSAERETFGSRFGVIMSMIGVAVGLGDVWRFPYMVGRYGGATFVALYLLVVVVVGIPALMAEWTLGRQTRRGTVGAFERGMLPFGRRAGWFFFAVVMVAVGYYTNVIGWVLWFAAGEMATALGRPWDAAVILPPDEGFSPRSLLLQLACTGAVMLACAAVLLKGLRAGIERSSKLIMPALYVILLVLIARSLTLPGAGAGVRWYLLNFSAAEVTPRVVFAALGQAVFSLSLGGTFMVVYGSYLSDREPLGRSAVLTALGDTGAGVLAGLAIIPAVFAFGLEPGSGPGLLFATLPSVFDRLPAGWLFGLLFFAGLFGAAYLSAVAAFEVLVAGITDNTRVSRRTAVWLVCAGAFVLSIPPMINMRIFLPWDLTFGSGMQTLGALLAAVTVGWTMHRAAALRELSSGSATSLTRPLYYWIRFAIPAAILAVGVWWVLTDVLHLVGGV